MFWKFLFVPFKKIVDNPKTIKRQSKWYSVTQRISSIQAFKNNQDQGYQHDQYK